MTDNTQSEALAALIERFRGLHIDHKPDGWPAVRTREITALLDRIAELEAQLEAIGACGVSALMGAAKAGSEPGAVALTDEQIHAIYDEVARREPYAGAVTRRSIVRAIEAAHGIKGGQHGTE